MKSGNILCVLNILKKYTDQDHPLSATAIALKVNELYDLNIDAKTVKRDINILIDKFDYDIETWNDNKKGYCLINMEDSFEVGEIRAIIDTFSYSNFIPKSLQKQIINKCMSMQNIYENKKLENYSPSIKDIEADNNEIIKNIEDVTNAIYLNKKISFDYYKYKLTSKLEKKKESSHIVTPYKLVYYLQQFYLISLKEREDRLYSYRLDRMKNIEILDEEANTKYSEEEIDYFVKNNVFMFSGNIAEVEIISHMSLLDVVIETYGKNIKLEKIDDNNFKASFKTSLEGFKYWCLRNIEYIKIIKPTKLKKEILDILESVIKNG